MPGLSASEEMQLEYVTWHAPNSPPIVIRRGAMEGIHQEVSEAFAAAPHRGAETGGILLGRREEDRIVVEDFEPVPSEHRFGPSYRLSDTDCALLQETLDWFRGGAQPGLSVLGFYRSHTLPEFELCAEDEDLMRSHFSAEDDLVLLVKPGLMGTSETDFFITHYPPSGADLQVCGGSLDPSSSEVAPPPPLMAWPAPRPRQSMPEPEPERSPRRRWLWYTAAALLGLAGGALGYLWWHPDTRVRQIASTAPAPPPAQPVTRPIVEGTPVPSESDTAGIRALLDRWADALRRGDVETAAHCYAPVVGTYFNRHNVAREAVRQSIRQARAGYGRLDVYRISGIAITPVSDSRAVATFRKHWQTSGRKRSSGDEEERMTLVQTDGTWQISSEQADTR
jgi:ketosteroid isomerase-like protein